MVDKVVLLGQVKHFTGVPWFVSTDSLDICTQPLDQGFSQDPNIQTLATGMLQITFILINICKHYWEMIQAVRPESNVKPTPQEEISLHFSSTFAPQIGWKLFYVWQEVCHLELGQRLHFLQIQGLAEDVVQHIDKTWSLGYFYPGKLYRITYFYIVEIDGHQISPNAYS